MSSVPKSRRQPHNFETPKKLKAIRKRVTELAVNDFGYDRERLEIKIQKFADSVTNFERKDAIVASMRAKNVSYYADFVEDETKVTRDMARKIICEFETGNSIFPSGKVIKRINPKSVTRERRRLKAYKRLLDKGVLTFNDVELAYKSWMGEYTKIMSKIQIKHMKSLFRSLFGKEIRWKRGLDSRMVRKLSQRKTETVSS